MLSVHNTLGRVKASVKFHAQRQRDDRRAFKSPRIQRSLALEKILAFEGCWMCENVELSRYVGQKVCKLTKTWLAAARHDLDVHSLSL